MEKKYPVAGEEIPEFIGQFIDVFEDFLEERNVDIPNDERYHDEDAAIIYGLDYDALSSEILSLLVNWNIIE